MKSDFETFQFLPFYVAHGSQLEWFFIDFQDNCFNIYLLRAELMLILHGNTVTSKKLNVVFLRF